MPPVSGGDGDFAAVPAASWRWWRKSPNRPSATPPATACDRGACGILGGSDGAPHRYTLHSAGREPRPIKTKEVGIIIRPGDRLVIESMGGGGWGDPARRTAEARAEDRESGLVG